MDQGQKSVPEAAFNGKASSQSGLELSLLKKENSDKDLSNMIFDDWDDEGQNEVKIISPIKDDDGNVIEFDNWNGLTQRT